MTRLRLALAALLVVPSVAPANDLAPLSDPFNADTSANWLRRETVEGGETQLERLAFSPPDAPGQLLMMPHTCVWYEGYRGPLLYKEVSGDFAFTTSVTVSRRNNLAGTPTSQYSLAGLMLRVPPATANAPENYVFLSIGHGTGGQPQFEVKTTMGGTSRLVLSNSGTLSAQIQIARVGDKVITLYRRSGDPQWTVHRVYDSDSADPFFDHSLGSGSLQAGFVTYTDWEKASTFTPAYQNVNTLTLADNAQSSNPARPFNPDLVARFDSAVFTRISLPGGFPDNATSAQYLQHLGANAALGRSVVPEPSTAFALLTAAPLLLRRRV